MKKFFGIVVLITLLLPSGLFAASSWQYRGGKSVRLPSKGVVNLKNKYDPRSMLSRKFSCYDLNRDGYITPDERQKVSSNRPNRCADPGKYNIQANQ